jgi:hypothetical protein
MKNVKVKDFRQGKTLYYVMAFPLESKGGNARVEQYTIQSRAYLKPLSGEGIMRTILADALWYKTTEWRNHWATGNPTLYHNKHSCRDSGVAVGKQHYNFHRVFKTRNQAQRYADRMNSGCLTHEERQNATRLNFRRESMWSDYGY